MGGRPNSPFSQAVRVGNVHYLSGRLGTVPGEGLVEGGIIPETQQTMRNIAETLELYGSSLDEVVKCTVFLADIADFGDMSRTYMAFFPNHRPAPSGLAVGGLVLNARVEIECIATVGLPGGILALIGGTTSGLVSPLLLRRLEARRRRRSGDHDPDR